MKHQNISKQKEATGIFSFRLPKQGQTDPYFGGSRSFWNQKIHPSTTNGFNPPIKSFVDQREGASRGTRFILWGSALDYFTRLASQQNPAPEGK